jgi:hypothetical protein
MLIEAADHFTDLDEDPSRYLIGHRGQRGDGPKRVVRK